MQAWEAQSHLSCHVVTLGAQYWIQPFCILSELAWLCLIENMEGNCLVGVAGRRGAFWVIGQYWFGYHWPEHLTLFPFRTCCLAPTFTGFALGFQQLHVFVFAFQSLANSDVLKGFLFPLFLSFRTIWLPLTSLDHLLVGNNLCLLSSLNFYPITGTCFVLPVSTTSLYI